MEVFTTKVNVYFFVENFSSFCKNLNRVLFLFFIPLCHAQRQIYIYTMSIHICFYKNNKYRSNTIAFAFREFDDNTSLDGSLENMERGSIASFGSGNTTDSEHPREKVTTKFSFTKGSIMYILPKTYGYITKEFGMETWVSKLRHLVLSPY